MISIHTHRVRVIVAPSIVTLALTALVACGRSDRSASADSAAVAANAPAAASSAVNAQVAAGDWQGYTKYPLTEDKLRRYIAAGQMFKELERTHPEIAEKYRKADGEDEKSLDEAVREIERMPEARDVLARAGISAREMLAIALSSMTAGVAAWADSVQPGKADLSNTTPANVAFIRSHRALFDSLARADEAGRKSNDGGE